MLDALELSIKIYQWLCIGLLVLYLPRMLYYLAALKKQKRLKNPQKNRLAVIVPARRESEIIALCLDSLKDQTYDPDLYDIHVVVADADDPTIRIAARYENTFVTVIEDQTSKGEALDGVLKEILAKDPDKYAAYIIVDADNLAAPDFIEEMNNALVSGRQIVCAKKLVKNWQSKRRDSRSFVSNCTALTWVQIDDLGNKARSKLGITINICGTGMMVRADVIKELDGWPYRSLTEDFELTGDSIVRGYTSLYYEHAVVYTEEAVKAKTAFKRRMRWIKGYVQCNNNFRRKIVKQTFSGGIKWKNLDFLYGTYPAYGFFIVSAVLLVFGLTSLIISYIKNEALALMLALRVTLIPIGAIYGVLFLFTLLSMIVGWRNIKITFSEKLALIFFNPLYMLTYTRIFIMAFFTPYDYFKWEKTDRIAFASVPFKRVPKSELVKLQRECENSGSFHTQIQPYNASKVIPVTEKHKFIKKGPFNAAWAGISRFIFHFASFVLTPTVFRLKVKGRKNLRGVKSAIITCNHVHIFDCLTVRRACRWHKLYITVADFNNRNGLIGKIMRGAGVMPLSSNFTAMKNLCRAVEHHLSKRSYVLFYPEEALWWMYKKPRPHQNGAYYFAVQNNVPIVPMYLTFEKKGRRHSKTTMHVMKPIYPRAELSRKQNEDFLKIENTNAYRKKYEEVYGRKLVYDSFIVKEKPQLELVKSKGFITYAKRGLLYPEKSEEAQRTNA